MIKGIYQSALDLKGELKLALKQRPEKKAEDYRGSGNSGPAPMSPVVP